MKPAPAIDRSDLSQRMMAGWLVEQIKSIVQPLKDSLASLSQQKEVKTDDEKENTLLLEVAKNTRGLKGKLEELLQKKFEVTGKVNVQKVELPASITVSNLSDIKIPEQRQEKQDLSPLVKAVGDVKTVLLQVQALLPSLKTTVSLPPYPKQAELPKELTVKGVKDTTEEIVGLREDIKRLYEMLEEKHDGMKEALTAVSGGRGSVSYSAPAISSVSVNALRGVPLATVVSVTTSPTLLPSVALSNRKTLMVYNDSANTVYIGGVDVTTSTGLPVPAASYSPAFDAGQQMKVYAIAGSTSSVRVLEVSSDIEMT